MVLTSLSAIVDANLDAVQRFFETKVFCPPQMANEFLVPWNDDIEEAFVFTSHTSIVSRELIYDKLVEMEVVEPGFVFKD